ncbi:MAG: hypothetical protein ABI852_06075 [Gemmatimonadaceae bacterium]
MEWNGESVTTFVVGAGGAWMVGASLTHRGGNYSATQRRGLLLSGLGFLTAAASARWMQSRGNLGIALSLLGTATAMAGMYILVKDRAERRAAEESESRK